jgi:DNA-binding response OmpR family regulator
VAGACGCVPAASQAPGFNEEIVMAGRLNIRRISQQLGNLLHGTSSTNEGDAEVIATGDFRIDLRSRQVSVRDVPVPLDREEFDMLVFLTGHPRRVVTPHTLLSTRWKDHERRRADFLRVLTSLRRKIEAAAGSAHYIRTEPWVFYRFDPCNRDTQVSP